MKVKHEDIEKMRVFGIFSNISYLSRPENKQ